MKAKKRILRAFSLSLAVIIAIASSAVSAAAVNTGAVERLSQEEIAYMQSLEHVSGVQQDADFGYDIECVGSSTQPSAERADREGALPAKYDLRGKQLTPVKDQGDTGICWAYSTMTAAESVLIGKGYADSSIDLSEKHIAYYTYHNVPDKLGNTAGDYIELPKSNYMEYGGNLQYTTNTLANWEGLVGEYDIPGMQVSENIEAQANEHYDDHLAYSKDVYHLQNCHWISSDDRSTIKRYVMMYGAAQTSMNWNSSYFNYTNNAYYMPSASNSNHTVTIVGWDDNYSRNNFSQRPAGDGAFLIMNSWGTDWGEDGFFWLSYYDYGFKASSEKITSIFDVEPVGNDYNIYQHDGGGYIYNIQFTDNSPQTNMACIYKTAEDGELLKQIGFYTLQPNVSYSIQVYTGVRSMPEDGKPCFSGEIKGMQETAGYHTLMLPQEVELTQGEKYSIVVRLNTGDKRPVLMAVDYGYRYSDIIYHSSTKKGDCFYANRDCEWYDPYSEGYAVRIKGITTKTNKHKYSVTIENGTLLNGNRYGSFREDGTVTVTADQPMDGYRFVGWESDAGVVFSDSGEQTTSFIMPGENITVRAIYEKTTTNTSTIRLAGTDRIATAIEICRNGWQQAEAVVIASARNYPDALAATPLASALNAPILLTNGKSLENGIIEQIRSLSPQRIYIVGGEAAISTGTERTLSGIVPMVKRLSGMDRYGTAAEIAGELARYQEANSGEVFIVSGENFPDALSISPVAGVCKQPILFARANGSIPDSMLDIIIAGGYNTAYIIGGYKSIGEEADSVLTKLGASVERVYGDDRYLTSMVIDRRFEDCFDKTNMMIATGKTFPDALAGAALAAQRKMPILLMGDSVIDEHKWYYRDNTPDNLYITGGTSAVSGWVVSELIG